MLTAAPPMEVGWSFSVEMAKIPLRMSIRQTLCLICVHEPLLVWLLWAGREGDGFCRAFAHLSQKLEGTRIEQ